MDSKYSSVGREKEQKSSDFKVKRLKLTFDNNSKINKELEENTCSNGIIEDSSKLNYNFQNDALENLQEARKTLPVYQVRTRLLEEIRKHSTMILIGETGSGKTTQIPQIIHEYRLEGKGCIAVTQPRRVAAITLALRVAAETNTHIELETVGEHFPICKGVRQGDPLSPKIFSAGFEEIFRNMDCQNYGIKINGTFLNHLRFADNLVLVADNHETLQKMLQELSESSKQMGLTMNKTKQKLSPMVLLTQYH
ncbi:jg18977 [Pararge aegeria aegeria]|uniref:RNA helicase n=1 Tax=Pararge aegeria aegeria TaxID=348720 RepID=A0A8S4QF67_9NEOP|nr:jg18977 [Pararge aegeria aegeria]